MVPYISITGIQFWFRIKQKQLCRINKCRKDKQYKDKEASTWLLGSPDKNNAELAEFSFICYLEYGAEKDGY